MEIKGKISPESPKFFEEVRSRLGGETLTLCYQCGTCTSSCPVANITKRFNPRMVIKSSILGNRKEVVYGDPIWLCCSCYNCQERCPQGVEIADLFYALRNIALREGHAPKAFVDMATNFATEGRVVQTASFAIKSRENFKLPPLKSTGVEALSKILAATSFSKTVEKAKEAVK
jgi:heterodisulfide reductase subunit C